MLVAYGEQIENQCIGFFLAQGFTDISFKLIKAMPFPIFIFLVKRQVLSQTFLYQWGPCYKNLVFIATDDVFPVVKLRRQRERKSGFERT